jgi:hypothetical protein
MVATIGGTDLRVVSSPAAKNISLFRLVETIEPLPSRAHQEGRCASSRTWSAGCDGRFECARRAPFRSGRRSRVVLIPRRWDQVGGKQIRQATVATKPGHRGEYEGNRKTIARGMPECLGVPVVTTLVCFHPLHTRLRVHRAPGIPCALQFPGGVSAFATRARGAARRHSYASQLPRRCRLLVVTPC